MTPRFELIAIEPTGCVQRRSFSTERHALEVFNSIVILSERSKSVKERLTSMSLPVLSAILLRYLDDEDITPTVVSRYSV